MERKRFILLPSHSRVVGVKTLFPCLLKAHAQTIITNNFISYGQCRRRRPSRAVRFPPPPPPPPLATPTLGPNSVYLRMCVPGATPQAPFH